MRKNVFGSKLAHILIMAALMSGTALMVTACAKADRPSVRYQSSGSITSSSSGVSKEASSILSPVGESSSSIPDAASSSAASPSSSPQSSSGSPAAAAPAWSYRCEGQSVANLAELQKWCRGFGGVPGFSISVRYDAPGDKYVVDGQGTYSDVVDYMLITGTEVKFVMKKGIGIGNVSGGSLRINNYVKETQKDIGGKEYNIMGCEDQVSGQTDAATVNGQSALIQSLGKTYGKGQIKNFSFEWGKID